jgi:hypothetical protein
VASAELDLNHHYELIVSGVTGDVKPTLKDVDASVEPTGGGEGITVNGDVSNPLA